MLAATLGYAPKGIKMFEYDVGECTGNWERAVFGNIEKEFEWDC
jgi:hypothetical protein